LCHRVIVKEEPHGGRPDELSTLRLVRLNTMRTANECKK
jgi:hypothetical protein